MARPKTNHEEKKQEILEAALRTFAYYGYSGTTNKLIAQEAAGISPALIYHYFPEGKHQLFGEVIGQFQPLKELGQALGEIQDAPLEEFLRSAAYIYLNFFRENKTTQLLRIYFVEGSRQSEIVPFFAREIGASILIPLTQYLQKQAVAGKIKIVQPTAQLFQFFGPLLLRFFVTNAIGENPTPVPLPTDEEMVETLVQTFLSGIVIN